MSCVKVQRRFVEEDVGVVGHELSSGHHIRSSERVEQGEVLCIQLLTKEDKGRHRKSVPNSRLPSRRWGHDDKTPDVLVPWAETTG